MRKKLKLLLGESNIFSGYFSEYGNDKNAPKKSKNYSKICLEIVKNNKGEILSNHVWLNKIDFKNITSFYRGDIFEFEATVSEYIKKNGSIDYTFTELKNIKKIGKEIDFKDKYRKITWNEYSDYDGFENDEFY